MTDLAPVLILWIFDSRGAYLRSLHTLACYVLMRHRRFRTLLGGLDRC
jgi:hypothetical protein